MTDETKAPGPPTRPSRETRDAEAEEARTHADAGRPPTPEETEAAESYEPDPRVAEHEEEMLERGAHQRGEGRIP